MSTLDTVMRQEHRAGEKMFVDYAGRTVAVVDRETGEVHQAQVFGAALAGCFQGIGDASVPFSNREREPIIEKH